MDASAERRWIDLTAHLVERLHQEDFFSHLDAALLEFVPNHCSACYTYPQGGRPILLAERNRVDVSEDFRGAGYLRGPYLIDPCYLAAQNNIEGGCFQVTDLISEAYEDSEYIRYHFMTAGMVDELGILFPITATQYIHLSLSRDTPFQPNELEQLHRLYPAIRSLMIQQWASDQRVTDVSNGEREMHAKVQQAFANFGTSLLTQREAQIAQLVLAGNSTKLIAERLKISAETVKVHRRHIYEKLDISSQSELFSLFINSMTMATPTDAEPLVAYHSTPTN